MIARPSNAPPTTPLTESVRIPLAVLPFLLPVVGAGGAVATTVEVDDARAVRLTLDGDPVPFSTW